MQARQVVAEVARLAAADLDAGDRTALADLVASAQRVRSWLDAFDAAVAIAASRLASQGGCEPAGELLAGGGRRAARDAQAAAARGGVCELLPQLHQALAAGTVSAGHADAVARVADDLDDTGRARLRELESALVASAAATSVEAFTREVRDLGRHLAGDEGLSRHERLRRQRCLRRWVDQQTGLCHTHLAVDPATDATVSAALDAAMAATRVAAPPDDDRTFDQLRADAMLGLITARHHGRHRGEIIVVDGPTLRDGLHADTVCETGDGEPIPPATVRRVACDADIVAVSVDADGVAVNVGRTRRTATWAQRRALRAMHRSCAHPCCTVRFGDCDIHHVTPWEAGGPTDLANLVPLCTEHHHRVHEGGWTLTLRPDRTTTWTSPNGAIHHHGPTIDTAPRAVRPDNVRQSGIAPSGRGEKDELVTEVVAAARAALEAACNRTGLGHPATPHVRAGPDPGG